MMNSLSLKKFLYFSLVVHLVALLIGAYLSRSSTIRKEFLVFGAYSKKPSKTLFKKFSQPVPFVNNHIQKPVGSIKKVANPVKKQAVAKKPVVKKQPQANQKKATPVVKKAPTKKLPAPKKQAPVSKPVKAQNSTAWKNSVIKSPFAEKKEAKKKVDPVKKKTVQKKPKSAKKNVEKKEQIKQSVEQESVEKKDLKIPIPPVVPQALREKSSADPFSGELERDNDSQGVVIELDLYNRDSSEMSVQEKLIQQEVDRVWRPPFGVAKGTECRVLIVVANDGHVKDVQLISKSKVLIFDLSVLRDIRNMKLDSNFSGKRFAICFRQ